VKAIRCMLFDYGNVISQPQTQGAKQKQTDLTGLGEHDFQRLWGQYRVSYDEGVIDGVTYWTRIMAHSRLAPTKSLIAELIQADIESWRPTVDWVLGWAEKLRSSGIQTGILSNMPPELVTDTRKMDWIREFRPLFFSAEIRAIKPFEPIYTHVTQNLLCKSEEALFIDDRENNVRGARRSGTNAIHHESRLATSALIESEFDVPLP
jgi:putative hydrolase of the HAD superfamily